MSDVVIVDTTVLLNVLDIPQRNQHRDAVLAEFDALVDGSASLLLPMAVVFETGNHIARLLNGGRRRHHAEHFCDQVRKALEGEAPWTLVPLPESADLAQCLDEFPDHAMRERGMGDLSIIKAWEAACTRHPNRRVRIWSLDGDLQSYDATRETAVRRNTEKTHSPQA